MEGTTDKWRLSLGGIYAPEEGTQTSRDMKDFVREAKEHGLLYVPIRNKQKGDHIELVVFADDATKIQRIYDNLGLDYVKAEAGEATLEKAAEQEQQAPAASAPSRTETVQMENGAVEFEVGGAEDDFNIGSAGQGEAGNFTIGREQEFGDPAAEKSPSEPSSPSKNSSPGLTSRDDQPEQKPSVKKELQEIKQEQVKKKRKRPNSRIVSILHRAIPVKRRKNRKAGNAVSTYPV